MEEVKRKPGRPPGTGKYQTQQFPPLNTTSLPSLINFDKVNKLSELRIDERMLEVMKTNISTVDTFISFEGGFPKATNIMNIGDPGIGKTTILLDWLSAAQNQGAKCLFVCWEMNKKKVYQYMQRFPQYANLLTIFSFDYMKYNTKDVMEQVFNQGYDIILIDSIVEVLDGVRADNNWDRRTSEAWLVETLMKQNNGENILNKFTSFLLIQQVTKQGISVGSNKLKHLTDAMIEMRRDKEKDGGATHMTFTKNRNGEMYKMFFTLSNTSITYGPLVKSYEEGDEREEDEELPEIELE